MAEQVRDRHSQRRLAYADLVPRAFAIPRLAADASIGPSAYLYLAFPNEPTLSMLAGRFAQELAKSGIQGEAQSPSRFHCSLLYLDAATDRQLEGLFEGLSLPFTFRPEIGKPTLLGDSIVLTVEADPALLRVQRELWEAAKREGCRFDPDGYSRPENYSPHISLVNGVPIDLDVTPFTERIVTDGFLPLHLLATRIAIGREDYTQVAEVELPSAVGDRLLISRGGPWAWPRQARKPNPRVIDRSDMAALLRGEVVLDATRRLVTLDGFYTMRGGPGSGFAGHAGRPGQRGGSAPSGEAVGGVQQGHEGQGPYAPAAGAHNISDWEDLKPGARLYQEGSRDDTVRALSHGFDSGEAEFRRTFGVDPAVAFTNDADAFLAKASQEGHWNAPWAARVEQAMKLERASMGAFSGDARTIWMQDTIGALSEGKWPSALDHEMGHNAVDPRGPLASREGALQVLQSVRVPEEMARVYDRLNYPANEHQSEYVADLLGAHIGVVSGREADYHFWRAGTYTDSFGRVHADRPAAFNDDDYRRLNIILDALKQPQVASRRRVIQRAASDMILVIYSLAGEAKLMAREDVPEATDGRWVVYRGPEPPVERGGPGSGFAGHAGRPGQRGGSVPGEGAAGEKVGGIQEGRAALPMVLPGPGARDYPEAYLRALPDAVKEVPSAESVGLQDVAGHLGSYFIAPDGDLLRTHEEHEAVAGRAARAVIASDLLTQQEKDALAKPSWMDAVMTSGMHRATIDGRPGSPFVDYQAGTKATPAQRDAAFAIAHIIGLPVDGWAFEDWATTLSGSAAQNAIGLTERGGPGSGHFGHAGRPGERGGSAPGEGAGEQTGPAVGGISEGRIAGGGTRGVRPEWDDFASTTSKKFVDFLDTKSPGILEDAPFSEALKTLRDEPSKETLYEAIDQMQSYARNHPGPIPGDLRLVQDEQVADAVNLYHEFKRDDFFNDRQPIKDEFGGWHPLEALDWQVGASVHPAVLEQYQYEVGTAAMDLARMTGQTFAGLTVTDQLNPAVVEALAAAGSQGSVKGGYDPHHGDLYLPLGNSNDPEFFHTVRHEMTHVVDDLGASVEGYRPTSDGLAASSMILTTPQTYVDGLRAGSGTEVYRTQGDFSGEYIADLVAGALTTGTTSPRTGDLAVEPSHLYQWLEAVRGRRFRDMSIEDAKQAAEAAKETQG